MIACKSWLTVCAGMALILNALPSFAHDGPDPRASWLFSQDSLDHQRLRAQAGPDLEYQGSLQHEKVGSLDCLRLDGNENVFLARGKWEDIRINLPKMAMTISAWVSIDTTLPLGGIVSAFQDKPVHSFGNRSK